MRAFLHCWSNQRKVALFREQSSRPTIWTINVPKYPERNIFTWVECSVVSLLTPPPIWTSHPKGRVIRVKLGLFYAPAGEDAGVCWRSSPRGEQTGPAINTSEVYSHYLGLLFHRILGGGGGEEKATTRKAATP